VWVGVAATKNVDGTTIIHKRYGASAKSAGTSRSAGTGRVCGSARLPFGSPGRASWAPKIRTRRSGFCRRAFEPGRVLHRNNLRRRRAHVSEELTNRHCSPYHDLVIAIHVGLSCPAGPMNGSGCGPPPPPLPSAREGRDSPALGSLSDATCSSLNHHAHRPQVPTRRPAGGLRRASA